MKHHKHSLEHRAEQVLRETVAAAEMGPLAVGLMARGWAIDMHTTPGTLSAAKGNGRVFYPGGVDDQWDTVIREMRPVSGRPDPDNGREVTAWQVTISQSAPLDVILTNAELAAGDQAEIVDEVRDILNGDDDEDGCTGR